MGRGRRSARVAWLALLGIVAATPPSPGADSPARFRQPVAMAFVDGGATLVAANRRSGSLSIIDVPSGKVVAEPVVGLGLSDLAVLPDGRHALAVDAVAGELLLLSLADRTARVVHRLAVGPDPARVAALPGGSSCVLSSRRARTVARVDILPADEGRPSPTLAVSRVLELPFSPLDLLPVRDGSSVVVADAFGGRIAVVDVAGWALAKVRELPAHNLRGLALTPDGRTIVVAHQRLGKAVKASHEDTFWGRVVGNHLGVLGVAELLGETPDGPGFRPIEVGGVADAAGDPSDVAIDARGRVMVALGGVDEVMIGRGADRPMLRTPVGRRPSAVIPGPDGKSVYVADTLDDTITVVAADTGRYLRTIALGPRPTPDAADRGERLFYDARLSLDSWMSCHSCHTDGHTNVGLGDTFGDGTYGAPKLIPSLLGVGDTVPWAWAGTVDRLEVQVRQSIETTMHGETPRDGDVADLAAYLRTLAPPPPRPAEGPDAIAAVGRGEAAFRELGCVACHAPPRYTSARTYDVGLSDAAGLRRFNPPSLRGVSARDRFLHDGRARSLPEAILGHVRPDSVKPTDGELADLVAFLRSL